MKPYFKQQLTGGSVVACLIAGALFFVVSPGCERNTESKYERAQAQTVLLADEGGQASGFIVVRENIDGQKRVFCFTAAHVVEGRPEQNAIRLFHFNGGHKAGKATFKARVVRFSVKHDLALLLVDCPPDFFKTSEFAHSNARLGDPVFIAGNARGEAYDGSVTQGFVSQRGVFMDGWPWGTDLDQATAIAVPGNSGGPVFNTGGEVVGVLVGWAGLPGISLYVPLDKIEKWAKKDGISWAVRGSYCPSDESLEDAISLSKLLLTPPPVLPAPAPESPCF